MALSTKFGIPPDENYHFDFIRLFTENGWSPILNDQEGYYVLGEAVKTPFFFYHYILSIPFHLIGSLEERVTILRILNIGLGVGSLYVTYLIGKVAKVSELARNVALFMLSNTLMFVFLSASINYDGLFIFLTLTSVLFTVLLIQKQTFLRSITLVVSIIIGMLVKINFLPIAFILVAILFWESRKNLVLTIYRIKSTMRQSKGYNAMVGVLAILLFSLLMQRYVINLASYGTFDPKCKEVLTVEQCRENPIFSRNEKLDTKTPPAVTKNTTEYVSDWFILMSERTFGIFAHKSTGPVRIIQISIEVILGLGLIATLRKYSKRHKALGTLITVSVFYTLTLVVDNYMRYQRYGSFTFAVQGRYMFAVLPLMYLVITNYLFVFFRSKVSQATLLAVTLGTFFFAGLPSYIYLTDSNWHNPKTISINQRMKQAISQFIP